MTFVITDPCIDTMDQSCVSVCPVDCIHFEEGTDRMLYINPVECIDCGACQPACPVNAIFPEGDVPADQAKFIEINELWYEDPAAAREKVGGGGGAPAAAPAEAPAAESSEAPAAEAPVAETSSEAPAAESEPADAAPAAQAAPAAATAAAAAPAPEEPAVGVRQVPATVGAPAPFVTQHRLPSALPVGVLALIAVSLYSMFVFPGPTVATVEWAEGIFAALRIDNGGQVGLTVMVLLPVVPLLVLLFVALQWNQLSLYAASHPRALNTWRAPARPWRRNEESRGFYLTETVQSIARDRFNFPDEANPDLRTYVNLPEPTMGIEVRGSSEKMYPDIVVLSHPGMYPVAIAQVETRETVTREQAAYVWANLVNKDCPLYIYVPAGMLGLARDYTKALGLKNVKLRTWRWTPNGMVVREG